LFSIVAFEMFHQNVLTNMQIKTHRCSEYLYSCTVEKKVTRSCWTENITGVCSRIQSAISRVFNTLMLNNYCA